MGRTPGTATRSNAGDGPVPAVLRPYAARVRRPVPAVLVCAALVLTACSGRDDPPVTASTPPASAPGPGAPPTSAPPTSAPPASAPPTDAPPAKATAAGPLTLAFGGDVHFDDQLAPLLADPQAALSPLRPYLSAADIAVVNLETAITARGRPAPKTYHFRAPPTALAAVAAAGVDVVSLANNHAVDYGADGFADTLQARRASPIPMVGIGHNEADALSPAVVTVKGRRVAVLGATQVPDWTAAIWNATRTRGGVAVARPIEQLAAAVRAARRRADVVVVYLHWGTDYTSCPDAAQRSTARDLARAGADVVVGTHAHRVQGAGRLGATYVGYGLGNFVWSGRNGELDSRSGVLTLTLDGRRTTAARWTPLRVGADGVPRAPDAAQADRLHAQWVAARDCTGLAFVPPG